MELKGVVKRPRKSTKVEVVETTEGTQVPEKVETEIAVAAKPGRAKKVKEPELPAEPEPVYLTYEDYPIEDLMVYAGLDCIVTSDICRKLLEHCVDEPGYIFIEPLVVDGSSKATKKVPGNAMSIVDSYDLYTNFAHEFIIDMELNGIKYDIAKNREIKGRMEAELAELEADIFEKIGKTINLDSGAVLSEFIYGEKGFKAESFTKTGEPSTDGDALKALAKQYPDETWLGVLAKRNDIASLYRTFIATYVEDFVKPDGRIHPSYNMFGTGSFRISGDTPNLTQLPRPKHGYNIRSCFTVDEGEVFIAFDFSSCEIKILGALCRDPKLLGAIRDGVDFHSFSAANMFRIDYDVFTAVIGNQDHHLHKEYKNYRQIAKVLT